TTASAPARVWTAPTRPTRRTARKVWSAARRLAGGAAVRRVIALGLVLAAAGCQTAAQRTVIQPLPEDSAPLPFVDLVSRARPQGGAGVGGVPRDRWGGGRGRGPRAGADGPLPPSGDRRTAAATGRSQPAGRRAGRGVAAVAGGGQGAGQRSG